MKIVFLLCNISITKDMFSGFLLLQYDKFEAKKFDMIFIQP